MKRWRQYRHCTLALAVIVSTVLAASALDLASAPAGATPNDITLTINTSATGCTGMTVYLPLYSANGASLNATIDFGDGSSVDVDTTPGVTSHTYATSGTYTITITGTVPQFGTANPAINSADCSLTAVTNWDGVGLTSLDTAFNGDTNLASVPSDLPSTVTDLANTFLGATSFNQNLATWNTANVVTMNGMFSGATNFNNGGDPLTTTVGGWNTSAVIDMSSMFESAAFDQDVESWDTSQVLTMDSMFKDDVVFNNAGNPLATTVGGWNTSAVTDMDSMFYNDFALDLDLDSWNTANVTDMGFMIFDDPVFDNGESPFATEAGGWNTTDVTNMEEMFTFDTVFNQDVSSWDTASVVNMYYLFFKAGALDQDLGQWSLASATDVDGMLDDTSLSTSNYDATLEGWAGESVQPGLTLGASDLTYDAAGAVARNILTSPPDDWTILNDSEVGPSNVPTRTPIPQATLAVTAVATNPLGQSVELSAEGGSGTGAVTFSATGGTASGCTVSADVLSSSSSGTCIVTATKAADSTYAATTSAPLTITFALATTPPTRLPGRVTIGFARRSHALGAGAHRALVRLSRALNPSEIVTVTAFAWHDASLAHLRAQAVIGLLGTTRIKIVINTRVVANKAVMVTRA